MAEADKLLKLVCSDFLLSNNSNDSLKHDALNLIIAKLLEKHVIVEVLTEQEMVVKRVFLCKKHLKTAQPNKSTDSKSTSLK